MRTRQDVMQDYELLKKLRKCDLIALVEELRDSLWIQGDVKLNPKNKKLVFWGRYLIESSIPNLIERYRGDKNRFFSPRPFNNQTIKHVKMDKAAYEIDEKFKVPRGAK
jgi:hypothetical protein